MKQQQNQEKKGFSTVRNIFQTMKNHKLNSFALLGACAVTEMATTNFMNSNLFLPQVLLGFSALSLGKMYHDYKKEHFPVQPNPNNQPSFKKGVKVAFLSIGAVAGAAMCNRYQIPLNAIASVVLGAFAVRQVLKAKDEGVQASNPPNLSKDSVVDNMKKMRQSSKDKPEFAPLRMF